MPRYADELDLMRDRAEALRRRIAAHVASEAGRDPDSLTDEDLQAADEAMEGWATAGEEQQDLHAFRPETPLSSLLIEHRDLVERIHDTLDRRLS